MHDYVPLFQGVERGVQPLPDQMDGIVLQRIVSNVVVVIEFLISRHSVGVE